MRRLEAWTRLALVMWAMVITMARAVRWPNDFAEAHWLLDYRFGLIKRGLAGSLLSLASAAGAGSPSAAAVAGLSAVAFAGFILVLLWSAAQLMGSGADDALSFAAAAVFATSPFVVMTAHFMGYLDHLFIAAAFGAAWLARSGRLWSAATLAAAGVLIHESFVVVGLPLVFVGASLRPNRREGRWASLLPFALPVLAVLAVWASEAIVLDRPVLRGQLTGRLARFAFVGGDMHMFVPEWLTEGTLEAWRRQRHAFWGHLSDTNLLRLMTPSAGFLLLTAATISPAGVRGRRALLATLAAAAPLLLHATAWDTARIWTYPIVAAFGCACLTARDGVPAPQWSRRLLLVASAAIIVANILSRSPLMDHQAERFTATERLFLYLPFLAGTAVLLVEGWQGLKARGEGARPAHLS